LRFLRSLNHRDAFPSPSEQLELTGTNVTEILGSSHERYQFKRSLSVEGESSVGEEEGHSRQPKTFIDTTIYPLGPLLRPTFPEAERGLKSPLQLCWAGRFRPERIYLGYCRRVTFLSQSESTFLFLNTTHRQFLLSDSPNETSEHTPDELFTTAVVFELALGALALFLGWALGPDARAMIPEFSFENGWMIAKGIGYGCLAAIPVLVFIDVVRRLPFESVRALERLGEDGMFKALLELRGIELVLISICAGVGEELLFRGWLMYFLAAGGDGGPTMVQLGAALVASSIAFGLVHPITKLYVVLAAIMGLYFGLLLIWTENLLVPIAAHAAYDAVQLIISGRKSTSPCVKG
jgi:membrane protease YdiL (CAAX protease family)